MKFEELKKELEKKINSMEYISRVDQRKYIRIIGECATINNLTNDEFEEIIELWKQL